MLIYCQWHLVHTVFNPLEPIGLNLATPFSLFIFECLLFLASIYTPTHKKQKKKIIEYCQINFGYLGKLGIGHIRILLYRDMFMVILFISSDSCIDTPKHKKHFIDQIQIIQAQTVNHFSTEH